MLMFMIRDEQCVAYLCDVKIVCLPRIIFQLWWVPTNPLGLVLLLHGKNPEAASGPEGPEEEKEGKNVEKRGRDS